MNRWTATPQRFLYVLAAGFLASAALHLAVFLVDGSPWAGPVSWRKPVEFAFSFGLTTATLAWILSLLPGRARTHWVLAAVYALASVGEVFLITMQVWRGVPSHFNFTTAFDSAVFGAMGVLVLVVGIVTAFVLTWSLRIPSTAAPSLVVAIRAGLAFLVVGQLIGFGLLQQGLSAAFATPTSVMRPPSLGSLALSHAIALHGVQVLPVLALLARRTRPLERDRVRVVTLGAAGYAAVVLAAVIHALGVSFAGVAPVAIALGLGGVLALAAAGISSVLPLRRRLLVS